MHSTDLYIGSWNANKSIDEKGLPEETVAFLFLIGFISAGISASFVGTLADRYGRKTACLGYCALYSLSCATLLSDNIYVLFFGRILGGVCGTVLWSVFESWMVAEFNQLMLPDGEPHLSAIFSTMTTSNTCVAAPARGSYPSSASHVCSPNDFARSQHHDACIGIGLLRGVSFSVHLLQIPSVEAQP